MADKGLARRAPLFYTPGNPEFPVLPDGIASVHFTFQGSVPGLTHRLPKEDLIRKKRTNERGTGSYGDWFLDGIWRQPNPVDFGNILAAKTRSVTVHNTQRTSVNLTAVDVSAITGLSVLSPGVPITIEAFDTVTFVFEASTIGDPAFDADVVFTVDGVLLPVRMLGRRVIIYNTLPQRPIVEQMAFLTDNMVAVDGTEQAFSLRGAPRSKVTVHERLSDLDNESRTRKLALIAGAGFLRQGVQLWWQARQVTAAALATDTVIQAPTADMEIEVGRDVSFVTPATQTAEGEVVAFDASTITLSQQVGLALPLGTSVMPLQFGFQRNKVDLATFPIGAEDMRLTFDLIEYADIGALNMAYFATHPTDGRPIITHPLFFTGQTRKGSLSQRATRVDGQTGDISMLRQELLGRPGQQVLVHINSQEEQHAWRQFLHYIRGSWGTFYVPTGTNDLPLNAGFVLGGNTFVVPSMGLESLLGNVAPRRDLALNLAGTIYYRRISSISDNGTIETVTLDGAIPGTGTLPIGDCRISWLTYARLAGDVATFRHLRLGTAELRFNIRGVIAA